MTVIHTPALGILNEADKPHQNMVVVVTGKPEKYRWAYVTLRRYGFHGAKFYEEPHLFTPLSFFGVHASMMPDGNLCLHQLVVKPAFYPDGKPRHWQGAVKSIIAIAPQFVGEVVRAVNLEFESRRVKAEAKVG